MILNDMEIQSLALTRSMINPFVGHSVKDVETYHPVPDDMKVPNMLEPGALIGRKRVISYGLSSFGYDLRLANKLKIFTNVFNKTVDPKDFDPACAIDVEASPGEDFIIIPPNGFALAESVEYMKIPDDVMCIVQGKSTYARAGIVCIVTPLEPGWEGTVTLEFCNTTPSPVKMYVGEGCCQVTFYKGHRPKTTYGDRGGKYQGQRGITLPKV